MAGTDNSAVSITIRRIDEGSGAIRNVETKLNELGTASTNAKVAGMGSAVKQDGYYKLGEYLMWLEQHLTAGAPPLAPRLQPMKWMGCACYRRRITSSSASIRHAARVGRGRIRVTRHRATAV